MKHSQFSMRAIFYKAPILFILFFVITTNGYSQTSAKWSVTGNTAVSGDFLGTTNNEDLTFKTNNTTAFRIKANGNIILKSLEGLGDGLITIDNNGKALHVPFTGDVNQVLLGNGTFGSLSGALWNNGSSGKIYYNGGKVGIGTSTPNFKLDVDGDVRVTQNLYLQGALIISEKIETPKQMRAKAIAADSILMDSTRAVYGVATFKDDVKLQSKLNVNGNTTINGGLVVNSISTNNINTTNFNVSSLLAANKITTYRLTTAYPDSAIYMGDSSLAFHGTLSRIYSDGIGYGKGVAIGRGNTIGGSIYSGTLALGSGSAAIGYDVRTGTSAIKSIIMGSGATGASYLLNNIPNTLMVGFNSDIPTFFVSSASGVGTTGAVAIGDTYIPAGFKLAVNGKIIAEEVNVKLRATWPDYVFNADYELMPLNKLENYISKNHHLPEIPSATEMEKNGINTAEMITKLVKKQEELTLYIIEQNKKIEELQKQNKK